MLSEGPGPRVLGVDVGNAKLKLCTLCEGESPRWISRPLPYDDRQRYARHSDFETGIPAVVEDFLGNAQPDAVGVVMTSGYAYPSYEEGARHLMGLLQRLWPQSPCFALACDGELAPAAQVADGSYPHMERVPFTNGVGAAQLVRRSGALGTPARGWALDMGGDTTQVMPIVDGCIDPAARDAEQGQVLHRSTHGKFVWVGSQTTPLETLASELCVGGHTLPVIPRGITFDHVSSLLELLPAERARKLSLFGLHPTRERSLRAVADALNLDPTLLGEDALLEAAGLFRDRAVARLASGLQKALAAAPPDLPRRAVVYGLGAALVGPALRQVGFAEHDIVMAREVMPPALADLASVYGAAHRVLEHLLERELPVEP